jgi:hypothetical protein
MLTIHTHDDCYDDGYRSRWYRLLQVDFGPHAYGRLFLVGRDILGLVLPCHGARSERLTARQSAYLQIEKLLNHLLEIDAILRLISWTSRDEKAIIPHCWNRAARSVGSRTRIQVPPSRSERNEHQ